MNFFIGVHSGMVVEMRLGHIAYQYLKGWFSLDMMIIAIDVILYLNDVYSATQATGMGEEASYVKLVRLLRLSRLLRIRKMMELYDEFILRLRSEYTVHIFVCISFSFVFNT